MSGSSTLLLLEADERERDVLCEQLAADGYDLHVAKTHRRAIALLREQDPIAAIVDTAPALADALQLVRQVRSGTGDIDGSLPLITLGAGGAVNVQRALEHGADDHVSRPYSYLELRARLAALLRRSCGHRPRGSVMRIGELEIDRVARQVTLRGERVHPTPKEYELLCALAAEPERVFTKHELLRDIWGYCGDATRTRTLDSHACRLRRRLGVHGDQYVLTAWGVGYRLTDLVTL